MRLSDPVGEACRARISIRWKLAAGFLLAALIPLGVVTAWSTVKARQDLLALAERSLLVHAQNTVEAIEAYLGERRLDARRMSLGPVLRPFIARETRLTDEEQRLIQAGFEGHRRSYGYLRVALVLPDRRPVVTTGVEIPTQSPESLDVIRIALAGEVGISDPFFVGPEGPYVLEIGAPVRDPAGAIRGIILFALPFDRIAALLKAEEARSGPARAGVLVDGQMIRIAHVSDPTLVGRPLVPLPPPLVETLIRTGRFGGRTAEAVGAPTDHVVFAERLAALRQDPRRSPFFDATLLATGRHSRWAVALLRTRPWAYAIAVPYDVFLAPATAQLQRSLAAMGVAAGAAALLAWVLGGILAGRLAGLASSTERLAAGDFAARAPVGTADEMGRLAQSFNTMAQSLQEYDTASRERVARLEALIEVGRAVTATLDLDEVLSLVVKKSVQAMGVHAAVIHEADPANGALYARKAQGLLDEDLSTFTVAPGEGIPGAAFRDRRPIWTQNVQTDTRTQLSEARRTRLAAEGIQGVLSVPILTPSEPYGVLALYRRDDQSFDPDQIRFATLFADQAAVAIENARLHEQRFEQMVALSEALRRLDITQPLEAFFRDLVEIVRQSVGARYGALGILGPGGQMTQFIPVGLTDEEVERIGPLPRGVGLLGHMLRAPRPLRLDDLSSHPQSFGFPAHHPPMRSFLGTRIVFQDRVIGALYLTEKAGGGPFTTADERLVEAFATNAAVAIANARAYQEVQEAKRELEAFTYTVSHDLKAPLRGIHGFSRALEEDYGDRLEVQGRRHLEMIRVATRRMDDLIEDLLKYSRLERRAVRRSRVDLAALCDRLLEDRQPQIEASLLTIRLQLAVREVEAEPEGLREAIANLVDNAIKFSKPGGSITVSTEVVDRLQPAGTPNETGTATLNGSRSTMNAMHVVVAVQDEGIGFDMRYHDRIFEIFQRLHRAEDYEGTGVGLAIVKKVAERHGGRAWATSELVKGSTFYLAIPHPISD